MGLVGEGAIITSVLPDVFPVIDVEDMQTDGWKLSGWDLCQGFEIHTPGAGLTADIALENLPTSGILAVIEQVIVSTSAASPITWGFNTAGAVLAGATNGLKTRRDRRVSAAGDLPFLSVTEADSIPFSNAGRTFNQSQTPFIYEPPKGVAVLPPGQIMVFHAVTADVQLAVTYLWRERAIEPSETGP